MLGASYCWRVRIEVGKMRWSHPGLLLCQGSSVFLGGSRCARLFVADPPASTPRGLATENPLACARRMTRRSCVPGPGQVGFGGGTDTLHWQVLSQCRSLPGLGIPGAWLQRGAWEGISGLGTGIRSAHHCQRWSNGFWKCLSLVGSKANPGRQEILRTLALRLLAPTT